MKNKIKKEQKYKLIEDTKFKKISFWISFVVFIIFLIFLIMSLINKIFLPATLIFLSMFLFCISYYFLEENKNKKISILLFIFGILLIICEVIYTLSQVI